MGCGMLKIEDLKQNDIVTNSHYHEEGWFVRVLWVGKYAFVGQEFKNSLDYIGPEQLFGIRQFDWYRI